MMPTNRELFPSNGQSSKEDFNPNLALSPHQMRFTEAPGPEALVQAQKTQGVLDESLWPDQEVFTRPDYGQAPNSTNKKPPKTPTKPLSNRQVKNLSQEYLRTADAWIQLLKPSAYQQIGRGDYHTVLSKPGHPFVYKVPSAKEMAASVRNDHCFQTTKNMQADYKALRETQTQGLFPHNFRIARTWFNVRDAIITQEKCDRMLQSSDLENPDIRASLKALFASGYEGVHNMDLSLQNLGVKTEAMANGTQAEKIILFDFREEGSELAGTFQQNVSKFLISFAQGNGSIYQYLDPRPRVNRYQ